VVTTFEWAGSGLEIHGSYTSLGAASAELPPGSYTTLRTYGGDRVLRLEQHVARLETSLERPRPLPLADAKAALRGAIARAGHPESRVRLTYAPPRLFVSVEPFQEPPAEQVRAGVRCVTLALQRQNPHAKHTGFIATAARAYAELPKGVNEALMVAPDGAILEGLSSNFFAIRGGALLTERERVLLGVTRAIVLEVAAGFLDTQPRALRIDELDEAQECFLTSVSREILPVVAIDERAIGDGRPGPNTLELIRRFAELIEREARPLSS
jgi:branched-subunit amino acid aminotransferase/4-amino-4-deoxychorismate lyase